MSQDHRSRRHGMDLIDGAVDCHVHACPHINARSLDVLQAARDAIHAGMRGIGLMDNFAGSSGYAALARRVLDAEGLDPEFDVFGGLIMEPPAGGVSAEAVAIALRYGYGPGTGARFISLPTHHTRNIARQEGRSPAYLETCLEIPARGALPDPLPAILDLVAAADAVLNTGHISAPEAVRLVELARARGVARILAPASHFDADAVAELARLGAYPEFSYFFLTAATQIGLTHVDSERHQAQGVTLPGMVALIRAAGPKHCVVSSDCGVGVLPPPTEGLREFLLFLAEAGMARADLRTMACDNPAALFRVGRPAAA
ncbi:MAG: hypothetical protein JNK11_02930 [Alphaproteobacteria bacterium]|nr:hypothetical protein [Alphaproteobacteria bacterium]